MSIFDELARCRAWIENALKYSGGTHLFEDVARGVLNGSMQLWPAARGCAVTEIVIYPRKKVLHVFLAGGEMDQLIEMIDSAADWGRSQGCSGMTLAGRHGWSKVLAKHNWKPVMTVLEKGL